MFKIKNLLLVFLLIPFFNAFPKSEFSKNQKQAKKGNAAAQFNLGICYEQGRGVEKDTKKAFEWYKKSAEQGFADAQYNLARSLFTPLPS